MKMTVRKVLVWVLVVAMTFGMGITAFAGTSLHVKLSGSGMDDVIEVWVKLKDEGDAKQLIRNGGSPNFTISDGGNYITENIDSIMIKLSDGSTQSFAPGDAGLEIGTEAQGTLNCTITVNKQNRAPVAVDDSFTTPKNTPYSFLATALTGNDSDPDGDTLMVASVTQPANGTLSTTDNINFTYTPNEEFTGTDSFTYKVSDGKAESNEATVTITVTGVEEPPTPIADLVLTSLCSENPEETRRWKVENPNDVDVEFYWEAVGLASRAAGGMTQEAEDPGYFGNGIVPAKGEYIFETTTTEGVNITRIYWLDENESEKWVNAVSSGAKCEVEEPPTPIADLLLTSMCSDNPAETRRWRVRNSNDFPVYFWWEVVGVERPMEVAAEQETLGPDFFGQGTVPANGEIFFETPTIDGPNTTKIYWLDEYENEKSTVKASGGAKCQEDPPPYNPPPYTPPTIIEPLKLTSECTNNPAVQRSWKVYNGNQLGIQYSWELVGTDQKGDKVIFGLQEQVIVTDTVDGVNTLRITWNDNGVQKTVELVSSAAKCSTGSEEEPGEEEPVEEPEPEPEEEEPAEEPQEPKDDTEIDVDGDEEPDLTDDQVPVDGSKLPKTGGIPASLFYGIGAVLTTSGFALKKKHKQE